MAVQIGGEFGTPSLMIIPVDVTSDRIYVANIHSVSGNYIEFAAAYVYGLRATG